MGKLARDGGPGGWCLRFEWGFPGAGWGPHAWDSAGVDHLRSRLREPTEGGIDASTENTEVVHRSQQGIYMWETTAGWSLKTTKSCSEKGSTESISPWAWGQLAECQSDLPAFPTSEGDINWRQSEEKVSKPEVGTKRGNRQTPLLKYRLSAHHVAERGGCGRWGGWNCKSDWTCDCYHGLYIVLLKQGSVCIT